jgi:acyl homoserine lactone synthase
MNSVIEFFYTTTMIYPSISARTLPTRRKTFRDRLDWKVECVEGMEKDQFDSHNTTYYWVCMMTTVMRRTIY